MTMFVRITFTAGALMLLSSATTAQQVRSREGVFEAPVPPPPPGAADVMVFQRHPGPGVPTVEFLSTEMGLSGQVVKGAPYAAEAVTETTQTLADGNRISRKSSTTLFRDGEGRTRREVTLGAIGPWASSNAPTKLIFIHDPVAGVSYTLNEKNKTARKAEGNAMVMSYSATQSAPAGGRGVTISDETAVAHEKIVTRTTEVAAEENRIDTAKASQAVRVPAPDAKNAKTEALGKRNIEGVEAEGTRTTQTIPAGEIGNDRPIDIVSERWYSPELQTLVMTRHSDPRAGETIYKLSNLRRGEPARQMFEVPSDYTVSTEAFSPMMRKLRQMSKE